MDPKERQLVVWRKMDGEFGVAFDGQHTNWTAEDVEAFARTLLDMVRLPTSKPAIIKGR